MNATVNGLTSPHAKRRVAPQREVLRPVSGEVHDPRAVDGDVDRQLHLIRPEKSDRALDCDSGSPASRPRAGTSAQSAKRTVAASRRTTGVAAVRVRHCLVSACMRSSCRSPFAPVIFEPDGAAGVIAAIVQR